LFFPFLDEEGLVSRAWAVQVLEQWFAQAERAWPVPPLSVTGAPGEFPGPGLLESAECL